MRRIGSNQAMVVRLVVGDYERKVTNGERLHTARLVADQRELQLTITVRARFDAGDAKPDSDISVNVKLTYTTVAAYGLAGIRATYVDKFVSEIIKHRGMFGSSVGDRFVANRPRAAAVILVNRLRGDLERFVRTCLVDEL